MSDRDLEKLRNNNEDEESLSPLMKKNGERERQRDMKTDRGKDFQKDKKINQPI